MFKKNKDLVLLNSELKTINSYDIKKIIDDETEALDNLNSSMEEVISNLTEKGVWNDNSISDKVKYEGVENIDKLIDKSKKKLNNNMDIFSTKLDKLKDNIVSYLDSYDKYEEAVSKSHEIVSGKPAKFGDLKSEETEDSKEDYNAKLRAFSTDIDNIIIKLKSIEDELLYYEKEAVKEVNNIKKLFSKEEDVIEMKMVSDTSDSELKNLYNV